MDSVWIRNGVESRVFVGWRELDGAKFGRRKRHYFILLLADTHCIGRYIGCGSMAGIRIVIKRSVFGSVCKYRIYLYVVKLRHNVVFTNERRFVCVASYRVVIVRPVFGSVCQHGIYLYLVELWNDVDIADQFGQSNVEIDCGFIDGPIYVCGRKQRIYLFFGELWCDVDTGQSADCRVVWSRPVVRRNTYGGLRIWRVYV